MTHDQKYEIILSIKEKYGPELCILAHHYQADPIVRHADITGDSLELARQIAGLEARYIVMCGVYFMAETAAILANDKQKVFIPEAEAGCLLANTAPVDLLRNKMKEFRDAGKNIIPLAYVNTSVDVKALCGEYQGSVCTSANAKTMLKWALDQGDGVIFLPDRNLAQNTADLLQIPQKKRSFISLRKPLNHLEASLFIWPGLCAVHQRFKPWQIIEARRKYPQAKVIVHPECTPEVVQESDEQGSTSKIIKYTEQAEPGAKIFIGTEKNLVQRLAQKHKPKKQIFPLHECLCSNMGKITPTNLATLLQRLEQEEAMQVEREKARLSLQALDTMLQVCK